MIGTLQQNVEFIATLHSELEKYALLGNVMLVGDFNAWIGTLPDAVIEPRACQDARTNPFGELLMTLMLECDMVTTTWRLDDGQPTYI